MRQLLPLVVCATFILSSITPGQSFDFGRNFAFAYVTNGYEKLRQEAELQETTISALCEEATPESLNAAQRQFASLVTAYSRIEFVRFGPVLVDNRLDRILFFPDRRGIGQRQIESALSSQDQTVLDPATLRAKSVALQGLAALEYLLFGPHTDELTLDKNGFGCRFARSIAATLAQTVSGLVDEWDGGSPIAADMSNPEVSNAIYRNEDEVLREFLGILIGACEFLRDTRLSQIAPTATDTPKPALALFNRSDLSMAAMRANAEGLQLLLVTSDIRSQLPEDKRWIIGSLDFELQNFMRVTGELMGQPLDDILASDEGRGKINYLHVLTNSLQKLLVDQLATELGLTSGFSALDGD